LEGKVGRDIMASVKVQNHKFSISRGSPSGIIFQIVFQIGKNALCICVEDITIGNSTLEIQINE